MRLGWIGSINRMISDQTAPYGWIWVINRSEPVRADILVHRDGRGLLRVILDESVSR